MREILNEKPISIPQVKEILEKIVAMEKIDTKLVPEPSPTGEEAPAAETDKTKKYFLKSTYDYVTIFTKEGFDARKAVNVIEKLVKENELPLPLAIQIVNINPETPEELALLFEKSTKRLSAEELKKLLSKINEYKEL